MNEPAAGGVRAWRYATVARLLWWLPLLTGLLGGLVAYQQTNDTPERYTSTSLVVASSIEVSPTLLARFGSTIFDSGAVANAVITAERLPLTPDQLIPDHLSVQPLQDSILFRITGTAEDAATAQALADDGARAFAVELNRPGKGIGTFAVQQRATAGHLATGQSATPTTAAAVGGVAGVVTGAGCLLLVLAAIRPVGNQHDLAELVPAPYQGRLVLWPRNATGLAPAGAAETIAARLQLLAGRSGRLVLHPAGSVDVRTVAAALEHAARPSALHLAVGGDPATEDDEVASHRARRVLVVAEGTGRGTVRRALDRVPAEPVGVLMVARGRRGLRRAAGAGVRSRRGMRATRAATTQRRVRETAGAGA